MVTIRDVARAAGVSIATVSRVCAGSPRVSEATTLRVRKVAAQLDYWPNAAARSLTTNRSQTLGVLLPDLYGEFFSEVIRGIDHAAFQDAHQILVSSSHARTETLAAAARSMRGRVDGLIIMAPERTAGAAIQQIASELPVVLLNPGFDAPSCGSISIANFDGSYAATRHLLDLGHRALAILKGPAGNVDAEERLRGYRAALAESGLDSELELEGDFTEVSGFLASAALLSRLRAPTAVFAANDSMAIGLLSALRDHQIHVPHDLSVIGFDDIAVAQYVTPALTTVRVEAYELGRRAVRQLLTANGALGSAGRDPSVFPVREVLAASLVFRKTCASPPHARPLGSAAQGTGESGRSRENLGNARQACRRSRT